MNNSKKRNIKILAIDTSCDDTSVAILNNTNIYSNVISSQDDLHAKWGGIVPNIARQAHKERIDLVINEALKKAKRHDKTISLENLDAIAVTYGPGLAIALEVGINKATELSKKLNIPLIAVNHMEGHLLSSLAQKPSSLLPKKFLKSDFPLLGLLISGGHTEIVLMKDFGKYEIIGETLDDAIGEAYDKVARMLGFGFPGGKTLSLLAKQGNKHRYTFSIPLAKSKELAFSYSGLKTAVFYKIKKITESSELSKQQKLDIASAFEFTAIEHLKQRLEIAFNKYPSKHLLLGGGVASSAKVRSGIREICKKYNVELHFPYHKKLFVDNGAMIGVVAYYKYLKDDFYYKKLDREPRAKISDKLN